MRKMQKTVRMYPERFNGLKLRTIKHKPKTSIAAFLDNVLETAGIPTISDKEFTKKISNEVSA